ncbi:SRPBCC domain-containing protein [Streptomyces sp. NPDC050388]|uniref:SRPBCC domain-containing protein n=1 Tax=Streptomyces sp. NPDC050388 TaxID=3155781 RepID=UPI00342D914F
MYTTRVSRLLNAPRPVDHRALVSAEAIARWRVPPGVRGEVHEFDAREGGRFQGSLTCDAPDAPGKSAERTDIYHGNFARLVPDEQVAEMLEFETEGPTLRGTMTTSTTLTDTDDGGTAVLVIHEGVPDAVPVAGNKAGARRASAHPARFVESGGADSA